MKVPIKDHGALVGLADYLKAGDHATNLVIFLSIGGMDPHDCIKLNPKRIREIRYCGRIQCEI